MWRKRLRFAIALFVVVFAAVVGVALRKGHKPAAAPLENPKKLDDKAVVNNVGPGDYEIRDPLKGGKLKLRIHSGNMLTYADGSSKFGSGVKVEMPDKNGRQIIIEAQEARITVPPGKQVGTAEFVRDVKLTTSDGIVVNAGMATYNDDEHNATLGIMLAMFADVMTTDEVVLRLSQNLRQAAQ